MMNIERANTRSIASTLKTSTSLAHQRLENRLDIMSNSLSIERYVAIINCFYQAIEPLETQIYAKIPPNISSLFIGREKTPLLRMDLFALKQSTFQGGLNRLDPPELSSLPRLFGSAYVLEGATLGGRFIAAHILEKFGIGPENGGLFFHGYGNKTGSMWNQFLEAIEEQIAVHEYREVVSAALQTFEYFDRHLMSLTTPDTVLQDAD